MSSPNVNVFVGNIIRSETDSVLLFVVWTTQALWLGFRKDSGFVNKNNVPEVI